MTGPSATTTPTHRTGQWRALALALGMNVLTFVGVVVFGWPAGNVFVLFWVENLVVGLATIPKLATASGTTEVTINDSPRQVGGAASVAFFCFHYGIFCVVHLVFTLLIAFTIGVEFSLFAFGVPAALIVLRYIIETVLTWFGNAERRRTATVQQVMAEPYPRIFVLQFAAILGFIVFVAGNDDAAAVLARIRSALQPVIGDAALSDQAVAVAILVLIKSFFDVYTTVQIGRGKPPLAGILRSRRRR